jgi:NAD(P)-dependent dehydrogenase (short-subunit alcohol dehydrogenase family)
MENMLKGRVAVVTGAGGGIGGAESIMMAARGALVVVNDIGVHDSSGNPHDPADKVVAKIKKAGGTAVANYDSVATPEGAQRIIQTAIEKFGRIDIMVNNAGAFRIHLLDETPPEDWDYVMKSHLYGTFYCTRYAVPFMKEKGYGRIINTASHVGLGQAGQTSYSAAKEGIVGFSRSVAREMGKHGITCNMIRPIAEIKYSQKSIPEMAINRPEDVAALTTYLATEASDHINACVFEVWHGHVGIFIDPPPVDKVIWKDGEWTPEELLKAVPETLTAGRSREDFPVSIPLWLENLMKKQGIEVQSLNRPKGSS